jgi:Ca2+-binding EF-hand superfamily protein
MLLALVPLALAAAAAAAPPVALPLARAARPAEKVEPVAVPDRLEVIFYARTRPVRLRVVVGTDGRPLSERWDAHLRKLFAAFDRNSDKSLDKTELEHIFAADGVRQLFGGGYYIRANAPPPELPEIDADGDGRVGFAEFARYYRPAASELVRTRPGAGAAGDQDTITAQLFTRLDQTGDGKLTKDELRAAEKILLGLDGDEDECVSTQELLRSPSRTNAPPAAAVPIGVARAPKAGSAPQDVAVYQTGIPGSVVQQFVKRYDKDGDYELTAAEFGLEADEFARLDGNGDGKLSATELDRWRAGPPDGEVTMAVGDAPDAGKATIARTGGGAWPEGFEVRQTEPGRLVLRVGNQTMEFAVYTPPESARKQQMQTLLNGVFPGGRESVQDKDLTGPQNQFLRVVFDSADFNADGKLTRKEFERYFELQRGTTELALALTSTVRTPNLFQMLDENVDGKLGVRELRTAWDRLIVLEPGGSAAVTKAVMQPSATLRLTQAAYVNLDTSQAQRGSPARSAGPVWFRKMDRNGDGDVSRLEFLGPLDDFAALDADGDGLISQPEVEAYEKTARPPKKK